MRKHRGVVGLVMTALLIGSGCVALAKPPTPHGGWYGSQFHVTDVPIEISFAVAQEHADVAQYPDVVFCWRDAGALVDPGCGAQVNPGQGIHETTVGRPTGGGVLVLSAQACTADGNQCDPALPSSGAYQVPLNFRYAYLNLWSTRSWNAFNNPNYVYEYDYNAYPVSDPASPQTLSFLADFSDGPFDRQVCLERPGEADECHVVHADGSTEGEILYNPSTPGPASIRASHCWIVQATSDCAQQAFVNQETVTGYFYDLGDSDIVGAEYPATLGTPVTFDAVLDASVATSQLLRACLAYPEGQADLFFCTEVSSNPGPGTHTFSTPARLGPADRVELQACMGACDRFYPVDVADLDYS